MKIILINDNDNLFENAITKMAFQINLFLTAVNEFKDQKQIHIFRVSILLKH